MLTTKDATTRREDTALEATTIFAHVLAEGDGTNRYIVDHSDFDVHFRRTLIDALVSDGLPDELTDLAILLPGEVIAPELHPDRATWDCAPQTLLRVVRPDGSWEALDDPRESEALVDLVATCEGRPELRYANIRRLIDEQRAAGAGQPA